MILWKLFCFKNNISNDYINYSFFEQIFPRLFDIENYKIFFHYFIFSNEKIIIAISIFLISFYLNFNRRLFYYCIFIFLLYLFIILIVHFATPLDFLHQIQTSSFRIVKTFSLFLGSFSILNFQNISNFKKKLDPRLYNGAILLGLNSPVVKSHGGTDYVGFANAISVCEKIINGKLIEKIKQNIN